MVTNNELDKMQRLADSGIPTALDPAILSELIELARRSTSGSDEKYPHPDCDWACHYHCTEAGAHPPKCDQQASGSDETQSVKVDERAIPAKGELLTEDQRDEIESALRKAWPAAFKDTHSKAIGQLMWATEQACIASTAQARAALAQQAAPDPLREFAEKLEASNKPMDPEIAQVLHANLFDLYVGDDATSTAQQATTASASGKLAACPFCDAEMSAAGHPYNDCFLSGVMIANDDIEAWNRRATAPSRDAAVDKPMYQALFDAIGDAVTIERRDALSISIKAFKETLSKAGYWVGATLSRDAASDAPAAEEVRDAKDKTEGGEKWPANLTRSPTALIKG